MEPIVLFSAFQKSTVFETVTKHREIVAEVNLFATTKTNWIKVARLEEPKPDADLLSDPADPVGTSRPGYDEPTHPHHQSLTRFPPEGVNARCAPSSGSCLPSSRCV
jgi:hypothetical protein